MMSLVELDTAACKRKKGWPLPQEKNGKAKKVTRVGDTIAEGLVYLKLPATTSRERHFQKERDLGSN
jgi:hypothetical protein